MCAIAHSTWLSPFFEVITHDPVHSTLAAAATKWTKQCGKKNTTHTDLIRPFCATQFHRNGNIESRAPTPTKARASQPVLCWCCAVLPACSLAGCYCCRPIWWPRTHNESVRETKRFATTATAVTTYNVKVKEPQLVSFVLYFMSVLFLLFTENTEWGLSPARIRAPKSKWNKAELCEPIRK